MKLQYLGTAAAEAFPGLFCDCENCRKALAAGGRNIRTRSQALINDTLLIDYPCDSFRHFLDNGLNILNIPDLLITHVHSDHFYPTDLGYPVPGYSHPPKDWKGLHVWGREEILPPLENVTKRSGGLLRATAVQPFEPFTVGSFTVTALKADHGTPHPYIYIVDDGEKKMLYAHDTGIFPDETWDYLEKTKSVFSLVSLDCTEGAKEEIGYGAHMCLGRNVRVRDRMREMGLLADSCTVVLNHFSHNGLSGCYDDFVPIAAEHGFAVSYDGMEITF